MHCGTHERGLLNLLRDGEQPLTRSERRFVAKGKDCPGTGESAGPVCADTVEEVVGGGWEEGGGLGRQSQHGPEQLGRGRPEETQLYPVPQL